MNALLDPFKALWQRKLWPVAVLLVGALVAVPMVLAKEPTPAPAPPANAQAKADEGLPATFVSAAEAAEDGERRRVLGEPKDPFAPAELSAAAKAARKKAAAATKKSEDTSSETAAGASAGTSKGDSPSGSGGSAEVPPVSAAPTPAPTYPKYSIKVRFGLTDAEEAPVAKTVERLEVLPSSDAPVLVYRGVEDGGKVAVFELTGSVVAVGDGKCEPDPDDCQILKLRAGETEFLTISDTGTETDAQYQLELVKINSKKTTDKSELAKASKAGGKLLAKLDRKARYAFDPDTGTLHKVQTKLSRASRRASL